MTLVSDREHALCELGRALRRSGYHFTTITPATQQRVLKRRRDRRADDARDVFGWSLPFEPRAIGHEAFELLQRAEACVPAEEPQVWRSTIRFSTLGDLLFAHSGYPTNDTDAVFFGPDSHRFVSAITRDAPAARRVVDVGCGSGVGGIALARARPRTFRLTLADVSPKALSFARVNAALANVEADFVLSDVLRGVAGELDLVIANPPYLSDPQQRTYRDGGGALGEALALRIADESAARLTPGGTLLLYTGSAIVDGADSLRKALVAKLGPLSASLRYEELDPDVFSDELENPAYARVERIAAIFLNARMNAPGIR